MGIAQILILAAVAIGINLSGRGRSSALLVVSSLVVYWLQPLQEPLNLVYWFPTLTLGITAICWAITSTPEVRGWRENRVGGGILIGVVLLVGLNRYLGFEQFFIVETPRVQWVVLAIILFSAVVLILLRSCSA